MTRCLKRRNDSQRSGSGYSKIPTCRNFNQLLFLKDTISNRSTIGNLNLLPDIQPLSPSVTTANSVTSPDVMSSQAPPPPTESSFLSETATSCKRKTSSGNHTLSKKSSRKDEIDLLLARSLANVDESAPVPQVKKPSSNELFCSSLVEIFDKLSDRNNCMARVEIQQVLLKYEFVEAEN